MTVNTATNTATYSGNGVTTVFAVPFYFLANSDLQVLQKVGATGVVKTLVLNSDYTLTGAGVAAGGSLTATVAPAGGATPDTLYIQRNVAAVQQTAYPANSPFPAASHEMALDRLTMLAQQIQTGLGLTLQKQPLASSYDLQGNTLINEAVAVNPADVPNLSQVQQLVAAGQSGIVPANIALLSDLASVAAGKGSSLVSFLQAGAGAVTRTSQDKARDAFNAKDFGVVADGVTNDKAAMVAAMSAASAASGVLRLPAGTIMVDYLDLPSNLSLVGDARGKTVIKRLAAATQTYVLGAGSRSGITLEGFTVDGNNASNSNVAHNILFTGCNDFAIANVSSRYAKGSAGTYGAGLAVVSSTDVANGTYSTIQGCKFHNNDTNGAYFSVADNFKIIGCDFTTSGYDGLSIINGASPSAPTERWWSVVGCRMAFNAGAGMGVSGFGSELAKPTSYANVISGNNMHNNTMYGLTYQSSTASITGNVFTKNGTTDFNGGVLLNAQIVAFTGNVVADNAQYGVDAGGCQYLAISGNVIRDNVGPAGGGCGLNLGASTVTNVTGNTFIGNGGAGGGGAIFLHGVDGGTIPAFLTLGGQCTIATNMITLLNANQYGISVDKGDTRGISVQSNAVYGGVASRAYTYQSRFVVGKDNLHFPDNISPFPGYPFAATLVIPDDGNDLIDITGTGAVTQLLTQSQSDFKQKVRAVFISNGGSGYTSAPSVGFSGGGGSGAAATAYVAGGTLRGIVITNPGSGYTSAPTITLTGGGGSGAAWTVFTECPNNYGRVIKIHNNTSGATVTSANNIMLSGGTTWTSNGSNFLTLIGLYSGNWYELSRS